jgi:hypothetical protein
LAGLIRLTTNLAIEAEIEAEIEAAAAVKTLSNDAATAIASGTQTQTAGSNISRRLQQVERRIMIFLFNIIKRRIQNTSRLCLQIQVQMKHSIKTLTQDSS